MNKSHLSTFLCLSSESYFVCKSGTLKNYHYSMSYLIDYFHGDSLRYPTNYSLSFHKLYQNTCTCRLVSNACNTNIANGKTLCPSILCLRVTGGIWATFFTQYLVLLPPLRIRDPVKCSRFLQELDTHALAPPKDSSRYHLRPEC